MCSSFVVFVVLFQLILTIDSSKEWKPRHELSSFNYTNASLLVDGKTRIKDIPKTNLSKDNPLSRNSTTASTLSKMNKIRNEKVKFKKELKQKNSKKEFKFRTAKPKYDNRNDMIRYFIRNSSVVCNDGSTPGYYLRKADNDDRWIIFLEGGWLCFDRMSCHKRWFQTPQFMTSQNLPYAMRGAGILSTNRQENSFLYNGNHVFVPYCSSDSWSGSFRATERDEFSFMGSNILEEVVRDLMEIHKMADYKVQSDESLYSESTLIYLAGSSAGGTGVLLNIDRISQIIRQLLLSKSENAKSDNQVIVRGISDSGWFIDNSQFRQTICTGLQQCSPLETIKKAMPFWNAVVPKRCRDMFEPDPWRCYFGQYVYPTLSIDVFVVQNLYDGAQLVANNVGSPVDSEQWNFIKDVGMETRGTLSHVRSLFAPGCLLHVLLTRSDWNTIKIKNINLPNQLQCWERQELNKFKNSVGSESKLKLKKSNSVQSDLKLTSPLNGSRNKNLGFKDGRVKRRRRLSEADKKQKNMKKSHCDKIKSNIYRRIDSCQWPHCNLSCPKLRDPYNGKEIDLMEILSQFDLDLNTVAEALGVKLASLRTMDQKELIKLLLTSGDKR